MKAYELLVSMVNLICQSTFYMDFVTMDSVLDGYVLSAWVATQSSVSMMVCKIIFL